MATVEEYLKSMIGDLAIRNATLQAEVDRLRAQPVVTPQTTANGAAAAAAKVLEGAVKG